MITNILMQLVEFPLRDLKVQSVLNYVKLIRKHY